MFSDIEDFYRHVSNVLIGSDYEKGLIPLAGYSNEVTPPYLYIVLHAPRGIYGDDELQAEILSLSVCLVTSSYDFSLCGKIESKLQAAGFLYEMDRHMVEDVNIKILTEYRLEAVRSCQKRG